MVLLTGLLNTVPLTVHNKKTLKKLKKTLKKLCGFSYSFVGTWAAEPYLRHGRAGMATEEDVMAPEEEMTETETTETTETTATWTEMRQVVGGRPWSERESTWLVAMLCTSSWKGIARAFKEEFGYARSIAALKREAKRLRDEPERPATLAKRQESDAKFHERPWTSNEEQWLEAVKAKNVKECYVNWKAIAIAFKDEFGHERSAAALRYRSVLRARSTGTRATSWGAVSRARKETRELLQQRDTSAEVFELLGIEG
jgi:hypothetical protein